MATFQRITARDDPEKLADLSAKHQALLSDALEMAKQRSHNKPQLVREILATGTIEGLATNLNSKAASVSYRAAKYKRTWHSLIPWKNLEHTTVEDEAESMIQTVEANIHMTETNSWPALPPERKKPKAGK
jgi:hypothetical protein